MNHVDATTFAPGTRWRLHPRVALRPEPFGALAYHYGNRRLNFLRSPDLVALVETLEHHADPYEAFVVAGLDERRWPSFERALAALARSDFLEPMPDGSPDPGDERPAGHDIHNTDDIHNIDDIHNTDDIDDHDDRRQDEVTDAR
ncbi:MAG: mycofactocin biosynthesis chaperone MftB [Actinomycetota bacterium]